MIKIRAILTIIVFAMGMQRFTVNAQQQPKNNLVEITQKPISLNELIKSIEMATSYRFVFGPQKVPLDKLLYLPSNRMNVSNILQYLKKNYQIGYTFRNNYILINSIPFFKKIKVCGFVEDSTSGERLISAYVYANQLIITTTNEYGYFNLIIPDTIDNLLFSYVGFKPLKYVIKWQCDTSLTVKLSPFTAISEVQIIGRDKMLTDPVNTQLIYLPTKLISNVPTVFGEADLLKAIQLMPGTQSGLENANCISVRGGGPSENLMLLDGVALYHYSHLLGLISMFDNNAIKLAKLYKSGIPASFGGRASSVIDIRLNDGNMEHYAGNVTLGYPSARIQLQGPIVKHKASFLFSARSTYSNLANQYQTYTVNDDKHRSYGYNDITAKVIAQPSKNDRVSLCYFSGTDNFGIDHTNTDYLQSIENKNTSKMQWGNKIASVKWTHLFNNATFAGIQLSTSRSDFNQDKYVSQVKTNHSNPILNESNVSLQSNIRDVQAKLWYEHKLNKTNQLKGGYQFTRYHFQPNVNGFIYSDLQNFFTTAATFKNKTEQAVEHVLFAENTFQKNKHLLNAGVRLSAYNSGIAYYNFDPRVSYNFKLTKVITLSGSLLRLSQPIHLLTYSNLILPTDLWVNSNQYSRPLITEQITSGISFEIGNSVMLTTEAYYKWQRNILEYSQNSDFLDLTKSWEEKTTHLSGKNYGFELMLQKTMGKINGWISYTYARAYRYTTLNNSTIKQPYRFDKPHVFNVVSNYRLSRMFEAGASWIFTSGMPYTFSSTAYTNAFSDNQLGIENNYEINLVNQSNNARMPVYHRLDVALTVHGNFKLLVIEAKAGVYNAYNRHNPVFMYAHNSSMYQTYIFPFMPFVQIKVGFDQIISEIMQ